MYYGNGSLWSILVLVADIWAIVNIFQSGASTERKVLWTVLVAGVVGLSVIFQGIQAVALPLVQEFGYTKEIEDRVLAPLPVTMVGVAKIVSGAASCSTTPRATSCSLASIISSNPPAIPA